MGVAEAVEGFGELRPGNSVWNHKGITILKMGGGGEEEGCRMKDMYQKVRMENKEGREGEGRREKEERMEREVRRSGRKREEGGKKG